MKVDFSKMTAEHYAEIQRMRMRIDEAKKELIMMRLELEVFDETEEILCEKEKLELMIEQNKEQNESLKPFEI